MKNIKKPPKRKIGVIIVLATILIVVTLLNTFMVFRMTSSQTMAEGEYQIASIRGELEGTINNAKNVTMELALDAKNHLGNRRDLEDFIVEAKKELVESSDGLCYNVYIAGDGWDIIPDLEKPEGFMATERSWYKGAITNKGEAYVTSPYIDAWTGNVCYSVAIELGDGATVIGVDYTVENIQKYIKQISAGGKQAAVIVTEDGIIAGHPDEMMIGSKLADVIPEFNGIAAKAENAKGVVTAKLKTSLIPDYIFATRTSSGFLLIVKENAWVLYRDSYIQLAVTSLLSIALFLIVLSLYLISKKNQEKAELALKSKEDFLSRISKELRSPLSNIINSANAEELRRSDDFDEEITKIKSAGVQLSEMLEQITSYSSIVQSEKKEERHLRGVNKVSGLRIRNVIIAILVVVMIVSSYLNISATYRWGNESMNSQVQNYKGELSAWVNTQKSILDMFCSVISTNPEMLEDYDYTVQYLDQITKQYPEISVSYMTNPEFEHTVLMNNGWEPDDDWHVEERQWYIDTLNSETGWSISAPYYDEQTGLYCITMSESVYDAKTNEFLGNFGIDFYMDKLIDILGASYTDYGYAFLVDAGGDIINHPYGSYQMSEEHVVNVADMSYDKVEADQKKATIFRDYDNGTKLIIASKDEVSGFTVYVVSGIWKIYGKTVIYSLLCILIFIACLIIIFKIITMLIQWQEKINEELKETADAAIAAGNAKSQFLAQMSHEIRTPINAVLGMNEMILRESEDESIKEYAYNIGNAGHTLLTLINSILDFSKIEDGRMEIVPVEYQTQELIRDLYNMTIARAEKKNLLFTTEIDDSLPQVLFGDDVRVRQVIVNLLTNAVKYTPEGSVTLKIECKEKTEETVLIGVSVIDTGMGIRQEDMEKLFQSFQRLDQEQNRNIEGTGLGISIVSSLLEMMDSSLQVESEYGKGSRFFFDITQKIVDATPISQAETTKEVAKKEENRQLYAPQAKILVVDDNEMNLKVVRGLLKRTACQLTLCGSGTDAIEKVKKEHFDIVFMDHMMPEPDGIQTLKIMQENNLLPEDTVCVVLTANAINGAKEEYLRVGFADYLSKPIIPEQLEDMLCRHLPEEKLEKRKEETDGQKAAKEEQNADTKAVSKDEKQLSESEAAPEETAKEENQELKLTAATSIDECVEMLAQILDTKKGLTYCVNSKDFYFEVVKTYLEENNTEKLIAHFAAEDFAKYQVVIHAVKSTSLTIGAVSLSEDAKNLEMACKAGDYDYVRANHEAVLAKYQTLLSQIAIIVGDLEGEEMIL